MTKEEKINGVDEFILKEVRQALVKIKNKILKRRSDSKKK